MCVSENPPLNRWYCWPTRVVHNELYAKIWPSIINLSSFLTYCVVRETTCEWISAPCTPSKCGQSLHIHCISMALLLSQGFQTKPCVCVRYKRKGLNQVGHSSVHDQQQQQQQNTQQQHDLHWNEHHEQSKLSVFIFISSANKDD